MKHLSLGCTLPKKLKTSHIYTQHALFHIYTNAAISCAVTNPQMHSIITSPFTPTKLNIFPNLNIIRQPIFPIWILYGNQFSQFEYYTATNFPNLNIIRQPIFPIWILYGNQFSQFEYYTATNLNIIRHPCMLFQTDCLLHTV